VGMMQRFLVHTLSPWRAAAASPAFVEGYFSPNTKCMQDDDYTISLRQARHLHGCTEEESWEKV
jgi:hypothetical protein